MGMLGKVKAAVEAETEGDASKTFLDKIINTTPVVMTVVATILAGLSSSEMSTAQYHRSLAAQNQSKAGDQWGLFQAKRNRQASAENSLDVLPNAGTGTELAPSYLQQNAAALGNLSEALRAPATSQPSNHRTESMGIASKDALSLSEQWKQALAESDVEKSLHFLGGSDLPAVSDKSMDDPDVKAALSAIETDKPELEVSALARKVNSAKFREAMASSSANARAFDAVTKPMQQGIDRIGKLVALQAALARRVSRDSGMFAGVATSSSATSESITTQIAGEPADWRSLATTLVQKTDDLAGGFAAARLRYTARRYAAESRYNMAIAQLYELDVHRSGAASDRHRDRSRDFFYGMLAAQAAVTIATLSLAVKNRSFLWTFATVAGALAVGSGVYVYLFT